MLKQNSSQFKSCKTTTPHPGYIIQDLQLHFESMMLGFFFTKH